MTKLELNEVVKFIKKDLLFKKKVTGNNYKKQIDLCNLIIRTKDLDLALNYYKNKLL